MHQLEPYLNVLQDEVLRIRPSEIITNDLNTLREYIGIDVSCTEYSHGAFQPMKAHEALMTHFHLSDLSPLGLKEDYKAGALAAGALMLYLDETQKNALEHISGLRIYPSHQTMLLDRSASATELTEACGGRTRRGTLLWLLDQTATAMGGRLLRSWIEQPLIDKGKITGGSTPWRPCGPARSDHVLGGGVAGVYDIERLLSRVSYKSISARDCLALMNSAKVPLSRNCWLPSGQLPAFETQGMLDPWKA